MRKFFSVWLILLVIVVFAVVLCVSYPVLTSAAQQNALDDLSVLLDAAFTRISLAESSAESVSDAANDNVLSKARAIDRFLAHDDALLETDALVVLCDLLNVSSIDVTDMDGAIVASSVAGRIGRSLVEDNKTKWTREVLEGENLSRTLVDSANAALLSGCVSRTDTEGLIYIQSLDVSIMEASTAASPEQVLLDMSFIKDTLSVADAEDGDKAYLTDDAYNVRRTENGVSLVASRPLAQVYSARSAVLLVEAIGFLLCMLFAAVIQSLLIKKRLSSRKAALPALPEGMEVAQLPLGETTDAIVAAEAPDEPEAPAAFDPEPPVAAPEADAKTPPERADRAKKPRKPRQKLFEFVDVEETVEVPDDEAETEAGEVETGTGRRAKRRPRRRAHGVIAPELVPEDSAPESGAEESASIEPMDAAIDAEAAHVFAEPQAVIETPYETPAPRKRRGKALDADAPEKTTQPTRRGRKRETPAEADGAFDKIFD